MEWKECADHFISNVPNTKKSVIGATWVSGITQIIYNFTMDVWKERNADRHGRDKTMRERLLIERALLQTAELYNVREDVLPRHKDFFYDTYEIHKETEDSSSSLNQWLVLWGPLIHHSIIKAKRLGVDRVNDIRKYFSQNSDKSTKQI